MSRRACLVAAFVAVGLACGGESRPDARDLQPMVAIPAGWFSAGCTKTPDPQDRYCAFASPPRQLWLSTFEIDVYETSWSQYRRCADAGACPVAGERLARRHGPQTPALVTWDAASAYCRWREKRLPTEAEWEKSARGTDERIYPWGDDPPDCTRAYAILDCPHGVRLTKIGTHPRGASPYGVHDLVGNAPEWVADHWTDVRAPHSALPPSPDLVDPVAYGRLDLRSPDDLAAHVCKGDRSRPYIAAREDHSWYRDLADGDGDNYIAGIRCARDLPGPPPPVSRRGRWGASE